MSSNQADVAAREFATAVMIGLSDHPRWLPCRFLYDERGSRLFDAICETPEYYLTRTESSILDASAADIRDLTGPVTLIELGSGSSRKTGHLLAAYSNHARSVHYVPVDVSEAALRTGSAAMSVAYPAVRVTGIHGTYDAAFPLLGELSPAMLVFLGSTVGNFNQTEAARFWSDVAAHLVPGDFVLLGVDLVKDPGLITAAYNDVAGHSAEFTRNVFHRMNRELGAGLDLGQIDHVASYNPEWQRIEIFARFACEQTVHLRPLGSDVQVRAGERIMTEISRKFVLDELEQYLASFGFELRQVFTDDRRWFAVLLLQVPRRA